MFISDLFENNDDLFAERWYGDDQVQNLIRRCFNNKQIGNGVAREWLDMMANPEKYSRTEVLNINNEYAERNDIPFTFTDFKWNAAHDEMMWTLRGAVPKLNEEDDEDLFAPSTLSKHLPDIVEELRYISTKMLEEPWGYLENYGYDQDELGNEEYDRLIELTMEAGEIYQDLTYTFRTKGIIGGAQQLNLIANSDNEIAAMQAQSDIDGLSNDYDIDIGRYINEENDDDLFAENKPVKVMRAVAKQMQIAKDWMAGHNTKDTTVSVEHIDAIKRSIKVCAEIIQAIRVGGIDAGVKVWYKEFYSRAYSGMPGAAELADVGLNIMYHVKEETGIDFLTSHYRFAEAKNPAQQAAIAIAKKKDGVAENIPQPGPSSGAPKQFGPDAKIQTRQMTVKQIISSIPGVPYYNNVVDDYDAKDYSWGVTKKVIEYATYLKDHPESVAQLPPVIVLNGKFEDGAHRVSAIWLLQQRMDPKNPLWANAKLNIQFVKQGVAEGLKEAAKSKAVTFFRGEPILSQERLNQLKSSIGKPYPILRKEGSAANIGTYMSPDGNKATSFVQQALAGQGKGGTVTKIQVDPNSFSKGDGGIDEAVIITNIAGLVSDQKPNENDPLRIQDRKQAMLKYLGPGVQKYLNDPLLTDPKMVQRWYNPEFAQKNWNTIKSGKQAVTKPGESDIQERMISVLGPLAERIRRDPEVISYFIEHNPGNWIEYNFRMNSDGSGTKVVDVKYYPPAKSGVAEGANWDDEEDALVEALEEWMMMQYDDQTIKTILSSPEAEPYKDPPGGVQWLYRAIVPRDREFNSIKASGPVIAFATEMAGAITFIQSLETSDDWVIIRKPFNPADFVLDFTDMYEAFVEPDNDPMSRYEVEHEVWMKSVPAYTKANKQEIVYTSKEHYGDNDWRKDDYKPKSTAKSNLRRPEDEPAIMQNPGKAYHYAKDVIKGRWPEAEPVIMKNPGTAYHYAKDVIKGRWPEAEPYIIQGAKSTSDSIGISIIVDYARDVIGGRWPKAEPVIIKNPEYAYQYARKVIGGRWPEAEPYIRQDPVWALFYAQDVIKGRWPKAEPVIMKSPRMWAEYAKLFNLDTPAQDVAENFADGRTPGNQIREKLNAWMEQDQQYTDPTQRASFQAKVWPYIQQNIKTILADKGEKGNGDYPAAPYAAWLLVQHMDAYPQNQIEFYNALKQAIPDHPKIQFLRDRAAVNQWIMKNANNPEYFIKGKALPNPTVNVRNPAMFKDAGIVATSREEALANAEQAGNKLLVAAVNATNAQTQPSYKQSANENFADGKKPGRKGLSKRMGVNTKASVSSLRKTAKHSTGEKQRMAHWLANMKAGRAKASKVKEDAAGVGVVKNSKDPRYVMATAGDQNDVTADTMPKAMRAYGLIGRKSPGQRGKKQ
jgi:hypothetical protein